MTGALPDFGAIIVTVDTKDGVPVSARTRSTRGPMVSKLLEGRQADESIPTLISMLYTLCPVAQSTAWPARMQKAVRHLRTLQSGPPVSSWKR